MRIYWLWPGGSFWFRQTCCKIKLNRAKRNDKILLIKFFSTVRNSKNWKLLQNRGFLFWRPSVRKTYLGPKLALFLSIAWSYHLNVILHLTRLESCNDPRPNINQSKRTYVCTGGYHHQKYCTTFSSLCFGWCLDVSQYLIWIWLHTTLNLFDSYLVLSLLLLYLQKYSHLKNFLESLAWIKLCSKIWNILAKDLLQNPILAAYLELTSNLWDM